MLSLGVITLPPVVFRNPVLLVVDNVDVNVSLSPALVVSSHSRGTRHGEDGIPSEMFLVTDHPALPFRPNEGQGQVKQSGPLPRGKRRAQDEKANVAIC